MNTKGFPELQALYRLYERPDHVELLSRTEFPHNYNAVSREAMYRFFDKHLKLNGNTKESETVILTPNQLGVWSETHPRPTGGEEFERDLLQTWHHLSLAAWSQKRNRQQLKRILFG